MYIESNNPFPLLQDELHTVLIAFDETSVVRPGEEEGDPETVVYIYQGVRVSKPYSYDRIVSAIITDKYDFDKMQAIINNHLLADGNPEHEAEYQEMQAYRKRAKEIAQQVLAS